MEGSAAKRKYHSEFKSQERKKIRAKRRRRRRRRW